MPGVEFVIYAETTDSSPVIDWLEDQPEKVRLKIIAAIEVLSQFGHEARRPLWAPLRNGIYELRVRHLNVNYRVLCFFHGRTIIVAAEGCTKHDRVDPADIDRAVRRRDAFLKNPGAHTYTRRPGEQRRHPADRKEAEPDGR